LIGYVWLVVVDVGFAVVGYVYAAAFATFAVGCDCTVAPRCYIYALVTLPALRWIRCLVTLTQHVATVGWLRTFAARHALVYPRVGTVVAVVALLFGYAPCPLPVARLLAVLVVACALRFTPCWLPQLLPTTLCPGLRVGTLVGCRAICARAAVGFVPRTVVYCPSLLHGYSFPVAPYPG